MEQQNHCASFWPPFFSDVVAHSSLFGVTNGAQDATFRHFFNQCRFGPFERLACVANRSNGYLLGSSVDVRKTKDVARVARDFELALSTRADLHLALVNKGDFLVDVSSAVLCSHLVHGFSRHFIESCVLPLELVVGRLHLMAIATAGNALCCFGLHGLDPAVRFPPHEIAKIVYLLTSVSLVIVLRVPIGATTIHTRRLSKLIPQFATLPGDCGGIHPALSVGFLASHTRLCTARVQATKQLWVTLSCSSFFCNRLSDGVELLSPLCLLLNFCWSK